MRSEIDAVAFDIDGTLYPDAALHRIIIPFITRNLSFMIDFGGVRKQIRLWQEAHPAKRHDDFFRWQASLMAERRGGDVETMMKYIDDLIYEGWKPLFRRVRPFPHLHETFTAFREAGLKIGILSDFLPSQKEDIWGLAPLCDCILGSEECGALKPSPVPFLDLASSLGVEPSRVLYVGNSHASDVVGASGVGMKTACIVHPFARALGKRMPDADISFTSYRQLTGDVLK